MIRLHCTSGQGIVPDGIRFFTGEEYINHCALEVDGWVWQIAHDEVVNKRPIEQWMHDYADTYHSSHTLYGLDEKLVWQRLEEQEGKRYDWTIIFCTPFYCRVHDRNRWVCSELIAMAIQELVYHRRFQVVNPRNLTAIAYANERGYMAGRNEHKHGAVNYG